MGTVSMECRRRAKPLRADHTRLPATAGSHDDAASRSAARGRPYSRVRPLSSDDAADDGNYGRLCCLFVKFCRDHVGTRFPELRKLQ